MRRGGENRKDTISWEGKIGMKGVVVGWVGCGG